MASFRVSMANFGGGGVRLLGSFFLQAMVQRENPQFERSLSHRMLVKNCGANDHLHPGKLTCNLKIKNLQKGLKHLHSPIFGFQQQHSLPGKK